MAQVNYSGIHLISFKFKLILFSLSSSQGSLIKGRREKGGNLCHNLYFYCKEDIFIPLFYEKHSFK